MAAEVSCPRCGTRMEYRVEVELGNGAYRRATYYYRCPRCGYRQQDMVLTLKRGDGGLRIEVEEYVTAASQARF